MSNDGKEIRLQVYYGNPGNREKIPVSSIQFDKQVRLKKISPKVVSAAFSSNKVVKEKTLTNKMNHSRFIRRHIYIHVKDKTTKEEFFIPAYLDPYIDGDIVVRFPEGSIFGQKQYAPMNLVLDNSSSIILFPLDIKHLSQESIVIGRPEMAFSYNKRQVRRYTCNGIHAWIRQGVMTTEGLLEDFNPSGQRIRLNSPEVVFNKKQPVILKLSKDGEVVYSGECSYVRRDSNEESAIFNISRENLPVLDKRKYVNPRVNLVPEPIVVFEHPLTNERIQYALDDITTMGFSVNIPEEESMLIPGLVLSKITLQLPAGNDLHCKAQVIYKRRSRRGFARYGFFILDMSLNEQRLLFEIVSKADDPYLNLTRKVNMDSLWKLFFESGFFYSEKFRFISSCSEELRDTYQKLYNDGQDIFTPVTIEENGIIYAHIATLKAYENAWIVHHLAANPLRGRHVGLRLLNHGLNYVDCLYRLPPSSSRMHYQMFYFRPDNKFPAYFFGSYYRKVNRRDVCSIDLFGYMPFNVSHEKNTLPSGWSIDDLTRDDLDFLREHNKIIGGGLMMDAFAFEQRVLENENKSASILPPQKSIHDNRTVTIEDEYKKIGLMRKSRVFTLKQCGNVKAALMVDQSNMGINMSDLLNSIKVIVTDNTLPWEILQRAVSILGIVYSKDLIPVLVYPSAYLEKNDIQCKRYYSLWIMDTRHGEK